MGVLRVLILTILVVALFSPMPAKCDCYSCWGLRSVSLQLLSGEELEGYIRWNRSWLDNQETQAKFPDLLLEPLKVKGTRKIKLYEQLHRITYPKKGLVVATKEPKFVPLDSLVSAALKPDSLDGYRGAGLIPVVSRKTAERLRREPPLAYCAGEPECCSVIYWISYNSQINEEDLAVLCKWPWVALINWNEFLEANAIIRLEFPYD